MEPQKLTDEQLAKLKALRNKEMWGAAKRGAIYGSLLFGGNILIVLIDQLYVHNQAFAFIGAFINAFMIFGSLRKTEEARKPILEAEIKKILESK